MIDPTPVEVDQEAPGNRRELARLVAFHGAAVQGRRHLDVADREVVSAADVQRVHLFDPLHRVGEGDDLEGRDHQRAGALGDLPGVADVIAVAVRQQQVVHLLDLTRPHVGDGAA